MSSDNESFMMNGQSMLYTVKETINYDNKDETVEVVWSKGSAFLKGNYSIEIYQQGGALIGTSFIELR